MVGCLSPEERKKVMVSHVFPVLATKWHCQPRTVWLLLVVISSVELGLGVCKVYFLRCSSRWASYLRVRR